MLTNPVQPPKPATARTLWVDLLRVLACLMVVVVHATSSYAFDMEDPSHHLWGNLYGSLVRASVPLFLIISGVLLLPVTLDAETFLKRRLGRVLIPFMFWSVVYSIIGNYDQPKQMLVSIASTVFVYPTSGMHLWYMYVLVGLYLFAPIISPWLAKASRREESGFLLLWAVTLLFPVLHKIFQQFWGEASWNTFNSLHYFSGFLGYMVLGHFLTKYRFCDYRFAVPLAVVVFLLGYAITFGGQQFVYRSKHSFSWIPWDFLSPNVVAMAGALTVIVQTLSVKKEWLLRLVTELSHKSLGIFFIHTYFVYEISNYAIQAQLSPALVVPLNTLVTFVLSYGVTKALSYLPKSKWIIG